MVRKLLNYVRTVLFQKLSSISLFALRTEGYLKEIGWFDTYRLGIPVDAKGDPVPWMTYPSISFLDPRIHRDMTVFEYSCGNSTLWWAKRVKHLVSCEHDAAWYERMLKLIPANVELHHVDLVYGGAYSEKITGYDEAFDIVVIDGRDRNNCAKKCLKALKKDGVIIWDNSDRDCYTDGYDFLTKNGFKRLDFTGIGPVNAYAWCTSVFYRENNCLGL